MLYCQQNRELRALWIWSEVRLLMKISKRLLPMGWQTRVLAAAGAALAGNFLLAGIPWPEWMASPYESAAAIERGDMARYLVAVLLLAPVAEEGIFRLFLFGRLLRDRFGFWGASLLSSLAFGIYHGNWIQGIYGCFMGMALAWGYESSEYHKYRMAVIMHMAANLSVLAVFG